MVQEELAGSVRVCARMCEGVSTNTPRRDTRHVPLRGAHGKFACAGPAYKVLRRLFPPPSRLLPPSPLTTAHSSPSSLPLPRRSTFIY